MAIPYDELQRILKSRYAWMELSEADVMAKGNAWKRVQEKLWGEDESRDSVPDSSGKKPSGGMEELRKAHALRAQQAAQEQTKYLEFPIKFWAEGKGPENRPVGPEPVVGGFTYLGWDIHWTGFKLAADSDRLHGQWLASKKLQKWGWYSGVPGPCLDYHNGDAFDITVQPGQVPITSYLCISNRQLVRDMMHTALADLLIVIRSTTPLV